MQFCVLGSGSKGNSLLIKAGDTRVLVDQGLSVKEACRRLALTQTAPDSIGAIIVTHEHTDHIRGLRVWRRRFQTPIYANRATLEASSQDCMEAGPVHRFQTGKHFDIGDLQIIPFALPHDAADPIGLLFEWKGRRIGVVTDLGCVTELVRRRLEGADVMIIESNHDPEMLIKGPYPWPVKDRIRQNLGHLSNPQAAELIDAVAHRNLKTLILAHISRKNNTPELASKSARKALDGRSHAKLILARQDEITEPTDLR